VEDCDEERVSDVLELREENNLTEEILDENSESEESESEESESEERESEESVEVSESEESVEVSELPVVQDGINELEITDAEIQPARLKQSQMTSFFTTNNLK